MERLKEFLNRNKLVLAVTFFSFSARLLLYPPGFPNWDEATYIQIGKYIFSTGQIGFLEPFRPLVWPVILGIFWKFNLDPAVVGPMLVLLFSLGNIILVYLIGKKIYNIETGILAALLLSLSASFFFWGGHGFLTEIPASFLGLFSVFLLLQEKYFFSGVIGALAFATKFVHIFTIIPAVSFVFYKTFFRQSRGLGSPIRQYSLGCVPVVVALLLAHLILYGDVLLPFRDARSIYTQIPFGWVQGIKHTGISLFNIEGGLTFFVIPAIMIGCRYPTKERMVILVIALLHFLWIGKLPTAVDRFLLSCLPYIYLITASGMIQCDKIFKEKIGRILLMIFFTILLSIQGYRTLHIAFPASPVVILREYLRSHERSIHGTIWISNPTTTVNSRLKIAERMYYPVFDLKKIAALRAKLHDANFIFVDSKDLRCGPQDFNTCSIERIKLLKEIQSNFHADLYHEDPSTKRIWGVFRREEGSSDDRKYFSR